MRVPRAFLVTVTFVGAILISVAHAGKTNNVKELEETKEINKNTIFAGVRQRLECYVCDQDNPNCNTLTSCHTSCYRVLQKKEGENKTEVVRKGCWGDGKKPEKKCENSWVVKNEINETTECCSQSSCNGIYAQSLTSWTSWSSLSGTNWNAWSGTNWNAWSGTNWNAWSGTNWNAWSGTNWNSWSSGGSGGSGGTSSFLCYSCNSLTDDCPENGFTPSSNIAQVSCQGSCFKNVGETAGVVSVTRGCQYSTCTESTTDTKLFGIRLRDIQRCCKSNLCNTCPKISVKPCLIIMSIIIGLIV